MGIGELFELEKTGNILPERGTDNPRVILPVGTRIIFLKDLVEPATGDHPTLVYAEKGEGGEVTGHGCPEGHWVKTDKWKSSFGAVANVEFQEEIIITNSTDQWEPSKYHPEYSFRITDEKIGQRLWRKETGQQFYGGYQIKYVFHPSKLSKEWIDDNFR